MRASLEKDRSPAAKAALCFRCLAAAGVVLWAAGCSTAPAPVGSNFTVSAPKAEFFKNGPAEQFSYVEPTFDQNIKAEGIGPDFELPKGSHLTMLKREFGYSRVVTDDGIVGYVSNDEMSAAPASVARVTRPAVPNRRSYRATPRNNSNPSPRKSEEPGLDLNDVPLPLPG
ncbi:MAG TPA: hypothetical protein VGM54_17245 [Chthoniobacter sp.]